MKYFTQTKFDRKIAKRHTMMWQGNNSVHRLTVIWVKYSISLCRFAASFPVSVEMQLMVICLSVLIRHPIIKSKPMYQAYSLKLIFFSRTNVRPILIELTMPLTNVISFDHLWPMSVPRGFIAHFSDGWICTLSMDVSCDINSH